MTGYPLAERFDRVRRDGFPDEWASGYPEAIDRECAKMLAKFPTVDAEFERGRLIDALRLANAIDHGIWTHEHTDAERADAIIHALSRL